MSIKKLIVQEKKDKLVGGGRPRARVFQTGHRLT